MNDGPAFEVRGVTKRFRKQRALDGIELTAEPGQVTVLLGPNGAGKSTLLRVAIGVLRPDAGALVVAGRDPMRDPYGVRRRVGYVPDRPDAPPWMTVGELCRFVKAHQPSWRDELADELIASLDVPRSTRLGAMSKGQAMKAMLVLGLAHDPDVLLLDEPFGGLDPLVREDVLRAVIGALRQERRTVICATHELDVAARIADRVAILVEGKVMAHGSVADVLGSDDPVDLPRGLHDALASAAKESVSC